MGVHLSVSCHILNHDALDAVRGLPDQSVDCVLTDPPYFLLEDHAWDQQWPNRDAFVAWLGTHFAEWRRVLRPGGSVLIFMGPKVVAAVEMELERHFAVLSNITWNKPRNSSMLNTGRKTDFRRWQHVSERVLFAEHLDEAPGKQRKVHAARGAAFEPIRAYLAGEWRRAGLGNKDADQALGTKGMAGHYFVASQWALPNRHAYETLQARAGAGFLTRPWDDLRAEYDRLRVEMESVGNLRPFRVTAQDQWSDVWDFPATKNSPGRHPCEKPQALIEHMLRATTVEGNIVLDPFAGSHAIGEACLRMGRGYVGVELDPEWHRKGAERLAAIQGELPLGIAAE